MTDNDDIQHRRARWSPARAVPVDGGVLPAGGPRPHESDAVASPPSGGAA